MQELKNALYVWFLKLGRGDPLETTADDYKTYEDLFYKELLDADGNIDLTKDAFLEGMYKEATLTSELTGFAANLDKLIGSIQCSVRSICLLVLASMALI